MDRKLRELESAVLRKLLDSGLQAQTTRSLEADACVQATGAQGLLVLLQIRFVEKPNHFAVTVERFRNGLPTGSVAFRMAPLETLPNTALSAHLDEQIERLSVPDADHERLVQAISEAVERKGGDAYGMLATMIAVGRVPEEIKEFVTVLDAMAGPTIRP